MKILSYNPKTEEQVEIDARVTHVEFDRNEGSAVDNAVLVYTDTEWYVSLTLEEWDRVKEPGVGRRMTKREAGRLGGLAPGARRGRKPRPAIQS